MTREQTKTLLENLQNNDSLQVMKAFAEGKEIEGCPYHSDIWGQMTSPDWNWAVFKYRVKPKPKYRPYRTLYEFSKVVGTPGKCIVRLKNSDKWYIVHAIESKLVVLRTGTKTYDISYETLLEDYEWDDGTPCGILETDNNK